MFERFDADSSGAFSAAELVALCASMGRELSEEQAAEVLVALDADGDGTINYDEFLVWWAQGLSLDALTLSDAEREQKDLARAEAARRVSFGEERPASHGGSSREDDLHGFHDDGDGHAKKEGPGKQTCRAKPVQTCRGVHV